ncbi:hypothetical protein BDZ45DRAFT_757737 [Acephala macrosclerotiorum]|nr:hypothetical protein BDZ45DRAFT_757737 [Acephala macrosclerotiorum]
MSYQNIYKGGWFNWSHESAFASTLTLSSRSGGFLLSFLSVYVTLASGRFWIIIAFLIHQERAYYPEDDGMHFQHQAILRNTSSPTAAVMKFIKIAWRWRGRSVNPIRRSLPVLAVALFTIGTFRAASILVADVTQFAGNQTLIQSPDCKWWQQNSTDAFSQGGFRQKLGADAFAAASYSRACYEPGVGASSQCGTYAAKNITWNGMTNASCPFSPELCFDSPDGVFQMDTGPIDSHDILGLNAKKEDRVTYRRITTCAPINATTFLTSTTDSAGNTNLSYSMGNIYYLSNPDVTFSYSNRTLDDKIGYQLSIRAYSTNEKAIWAPQIRKLNADITIMFLTANSISYAAPSSDLLFSANQEVDLIQLNKSKTYYRPDNLVSVLGCTDQHQVCALGLPTPGLSQCTPLGNASALNLASKAFNHHQYSTAALIYRAVWLSSIFYLVDPRGSNALRASESVFELYSSALPSTQWKLEVSNWFSAALSKTQYALVEMASGPANYPDIAYFPPPNITKYLCNAQMVRSGEYMNFSVLGMAITVTLSTFFIVLSFVLDRLIGWIRGQVHKGENMSQQWDLDDNLQLQRMAYEGAKQGTWEGHGESVPVTQQGDKLSPLLKLHGNETALEEGKKGKLYEQVQSVGEDMEKKGSPSATETASRA